MLETTPQFDLVAGGAVARIAPAPGGRVAALAVDGIDLVKSSGLGAISWGIYPMAPWAGRLREGVLAWRGAEHRLPTDLTPPHAIHGTLLEREWRVVERGPASAALATDLRDPWPFGGLVSHRIRLEEGALHLALRVESTGVPFPAIVGWHPWFVRRLVAPDGAAAGGPAQLAFAPGGMLERGDDYLPTGRILRPAPAEPWDDCFVEVAGSPTLTWPGAFEVTIESACPWWVCYTQPPDALCVEPQTGPPNGLNTGEAVVVEPGQPLEAAMTLRWRRLG